MPILPGTEVKVHAYVQNASLRHMLEWIFRDEERGLLLGFRLSTADDPTEEIPEADIVLIDALLFSNHFPPELEEYLKKHHPGAHLVLMSESDKRELVLKFAESTKLDFKAIMGLEQLTTQSPLIFALRQIKEHGRAFPFD